MPTPTANSSGSMFESVFGKPANPLWVLRGFAMAALAVLLLAMFVFKSGPRHDFCIGLAVGTLVGLLVQLFATSSVEVNQDPQRCDVQDLRITR